MLDSLRLIAQMDAVTKSWWAAWKQEKLVDFIPQPSKWVKSNENVGVGDLVIFLKADTDKSFGTEVWRMGRVKEVEVSRDKLVRVVIIEYKNHGESVFRTTRRAVRKIAVLHHEGELELIEELNLASKAAGTAFLLG